MACTLGPPVMPAPARSTNGSPLLAAALFCLLPGCVRPSVVSTTGSGRERHDASRPAATSPRSSPTPVRVPAPVLEHPTRAACRDEPAGRLAFVTCDGAFIAVGGPVAFHPDRRRPPKRAREVLAAVAGVLRERQDLLLVRIEVYSSRETGSDPTRIRREIRLTQARADALFRHLWRREHVWAERLEAVGYGSSELFRGSSERWPVVLRVVQHARDGGSP